MDSICKELVESYNANILDTVDKDIKDTFAKESIKRIGTGIGRQTATRFIQNYMNPAP